MAVELRDPVCIAMNDASQVGEARRAARVIALRLGFGEDKAGQLAIVVNEAANNAVRHGKAGEIILRPIDRGQTLGVEMLAIDRGVGIPSVSFALRDGFSTGGTQGTGLGAIRRLSSEFDIFSNIDKAAGGTGTVVFSRLWNADAVPPPEGGLEVGVVCLPKPPEEACGDHWTVLHDAGRLTVVIADGLGHGPQASEASSKAIAVCQENAAFDPLRLMDALHAALRSTRGAAISLIELKPRESSALAVGVGNISSLLLTADGVMKNMLTHNGTVGVEARRIQAAPYAWPAGATLIMHSDGLATQWQVGKYPGLVNRHPSVIAGVLYRDYRRIRDDVTVLVARQVSPNREARP